MFEAYCKDKLAPLALRLMLGSVCVYHGYLKIMAAGGTNWSPGLPTGWQVVIAWAEFACGLAVLFGFRCRLSAAALVAVTIGTLAWLQGWGLVRLPVRSLEPSYMTAMAAVAVILLGAGELSVDGRSGRLSPARAAAKR